MLLVLLICKTDILQMIVCRWIGGTEFKKEFGLFCRLHELFYFCINFQKKIVFHEVYSFSFLGQNEFYSLFMFEKISVLLTCLIG